MRKYLIQVSLGYNFVDLVVTASCPNSANQAARKLVHSDPKLALFKHRYTRYSI